MNGREETRGVDELPNEMTITMPVATGRLITDSWILYELLAPYIEHYNTEVWAHLLRLILRHNHFNNTGREDIYHQQLVALKHALQEIIDKIEVKRKRRKLCKSR